MTQTTTVQPFTVEELKAAYVRSVQDETDAWLVYDRASEAEHEALQRARQAFEAYREAGERRHEAFQRWWKAL